MSEERIMILTMLQEGKISSEEAAKLLDALDEAELKESEKYYSDTDCEATAISFENISNKISKKIDKHSKEFETWGNNFGEKLSDKLGNLENEITEGAISFTDKVLSFVDDLVDKGTFASIFGVYDTVTDTIEKDLSSIDNPSLEIQAKNGKITVKPWDKEIVSIKAICQFKKGSYDKNSSVYDVIEDENRVIFKPKYSGNVGAKLDVFIPEKHYEQIFLFTSNGKIEIEEIKAKEFLFDTSNSSINLCDLHSNKIKACTKNGKIIATDIVSELLDVTTTNSAIALSDINSRHIKASTKNSKILTSDITSDQLNLTTSNGQIIVEDCESKFVKCKTHNANIKVSDIDTSTLNNIELDTSNGQIELLLDKKDTVFNIDATTSMGHIDIDIPNLVYTLNNQQHLGNKKILAHSSNYSEDNSSVNIIAFTSNGTIKIG